MASSSTNNSSSGSHQSTNIKQELYNALMKEDWKKVLRIFRNHPEIHATKIAEMVPENEELRRNDDQYEFDTALHWAITYKADELTVAKLVSAIKEAAKSSDEASRILKSENKRGDTPLHCAASRGSTLICMAITENDKSLVGLPNKDEETPLFLAALNGHGTTFLYLLSVYKAHDPSLPPSIWQRKNGDTILHCTIRRNYFGLSYEIIRHLRNENIGSFFNEGGKLPLDEIVSIPSAFRNSIHLGWWQRLCYFFIYIERPDSKRRISRNSERQKHLLVELQGRLNSVKNHSSPNIDSEQTETHWSHSQETVDQGTSNSNDHQSMSSFFTVFSRMLKNNHMLSDLLMDELVKQDPWYREKDHAMQVQNIKNHKYYPEKDMEIQGGRIKISTALLIAAKNGLVEQVKKILDDIPVSIHDQSLTEKKNIVHVAIEERQSHVLEEVKKRKHWPVLKEKVDAYGNNALHLAAKQSKHITSGIHGSVMQMQWEIMWFEYVKEYMPPYFISQLNNNNETPGDIFTKQHKKLIKDCNESVKDTCASYIVASTLVNGSTFSACFQRDIDRFGHTFSLSLLVSFLFSITSLATFLAIYLARKVQPKGFRRSLPLKLCLGIISFLVSLVSMLLAFYVALSHDFQPKEKYKPMIVLYGVILSPVAFLYIITQIPLYLNLFIVSFKRVPNPRIVEEENISRFFPDVSKKNKEDHNQPSVRDVERANTST